MLRMNSYSLGSSINYSYIYSYELSTFAKYFQTVDRYCLSTAYTQNKRSRKVQKGAAALPCIWG